MNLKDQVLFKCAFCNSGPILLAWPQLQMVCSVCGAESPPAPPVSNSDPAGSSEAAISAAIDAWNWTREDTRTARLLTKVVYQLVSLAKLAIPNAVTERYKWLDDLSDDDVSAIQAAQDKARRQITHACPSKYRAYLAAEFAQIDAVRQVDAERFFASLAGVDPTDKKVAPGSTEKTYTISQLRGAWGAGFHQGKEARS